MNKSTIWKNYRFPIILLSGIAIGAVLGIVLGEKAKVLAPLGDIFLNLMFTIVVPMVFVSIASAVGNMVNMKRLGRIMGSLVTVFVVTGAIAGVLVLVVVNIFPPAAGTSIQFASAQMEEMSSVGDMIVGALTVDDFSGLMSRRNMLPIIVFAILSGFCVSACGGEESPVGKLLNNLNAIIMKIVSIIMMYAPIGLGAYFASLVGGFGPGLIGDYGHAMLVYYPMCLLYFFTAFPAYAYFAGGKAGVGRMFGHILNPAVTAFATQSSIAALPVNAEACDRIGVPKDIRDIVLPMGATMHMDGSCFSCVLKIAFVLGAMGVDMPWTMLPAVVAVAVLSSVGMSGVPGGGYIGEYIICSIFFPQQIEVAFPILVAIGNLVDPPATMINSAGDYVVCYIVARVTDGKDWLDRAIAARHAK